LAADGTHLWSERYDRSMADVLAIQDEIALSEILAGRRPFAGQTTSAVM
jgi:TolB-like protein